MQKISIILLMLSVIIPTIVQAAGDSHGGLSTLIPPIVNFTLLFGFLIYKLKKPLSQMFTNKAQEVEELVAHAQEKDKQATEEYELYSTKLANLPSEREKLIEEAKIEAQNFDKKKSIETKEQLEKMQQDANEKIENEKRAMIKELGYELVENVVSKTRERVIMDKKIQTKATQSLVANF